MSQEQVFEFYQDQDLWKGIPDDILLELKEGLE
jgi:hypothetical protein